ISVNGPLTGGARIAGTLELGETNVQIPSSSIGGTGEVPEIVHLNEPPPVRGTRRRAGLLEQASTGRTSGPSFPLDVTINAPSRIFVRGRGLDSEFGGALRVTGSTSSVVPIGAFNLIRGRLDILGQRLALSEATISMQGSFIPILRILATTQSDEYTINVLVSGRASSPEILFTSQPDLPQEEVLARLIFGRGLETLSPIQAARLALAVRTLAGQGGEGVVGNIRNSTGLADLDVTTDEEGNAAVRAGAYLGENIYTDVEVNSGGETKLNLNLDVSPSVTVKGSVSTEGDTSLGVFFERDY
ncbi:MAG: translocation/assembly module TamB domain-containing protein, partial [Paracoccaceae bacterium]